MLHKGNRDSLSGHSHKEELPPMERQRKTELIFELTIPFIERSRILKQIALVSRHASYWASQKLFRELEWMRIYKPEDEAVAALLRGLEGWRYASSVRSIVICVDVAEAPLPKYSSHEDVIVKLLRRLPGLSSLTLRLELHGSDEPRAAPVKAFNFNVVADAMAKLPQLKSFVFSDSNYTFSNAQPVEVDGDLVGMLVFGSRLKALKVEESRPSKFIENLIRCVAPNVQDLKLPHPDEEDDDTSLLETIASLQFPQLTSLSIRDSEEFDFAAFAARHPSIKSLDYELDYDQQRLSTVDLSECRSLERLIITDNLTSTEIGRMISQLPHPELLLALDISLQETDMESPIYDFCSDFPNLEDLTIKGWFSNSTSASPHWPDEMDHRFDYYSKPVPSSLYSGDTMEFTNPYPNLAKVLPSLKRLNIRSAPVRFIDIPLPPFRWIWIDDRNLKKIFGPKHWNKYPDDGGEKELKSLQSERLWSWCDATREMLASGVLGFASQVHSFEQLRWEPYHLGRNPFIIDVIVRRQEDGEILIDGGFGRSESYRGPIYDGPWGLPLSGDSSESGDDGSTSRSLNYDE